MGVSTFLLDRRTAILMVGGTRQIVGTLRRFFKLTEMDAKRVGELKAAEEVSPSPAAAMIIEPSELPLATEPEKVVAAHLVLGWDEGRGSVTDFGWDFLPTIGYAVRDLTANVFVLYEERDQHLRLLGARRAEELSLLDAQGRLMRHGQPLITRCENVRPFLDRYADADCILSTGIKKTLMTRIEGGKFPSADWFIGKRPMDVVCYAGR